MSFQRGRTGDDEERRREAGPSAADATPHVELSAADEPARREGTHAPVWAIDDARIHACAPRRPKGGRATAVCGRAVRREPLDLGAALRTFEALWTSERREARDCCIECAQALALPPRPPVVRPFASEVAEPSKISMKVIVASAAVASITLLRVAALALRHR